ncbi:hypothetical protein FRC11_011664, partial [Ceratobasidium sp. 423]
MLQLTNGYPAHVKHPDEGIRNLVIYQESIKRDLKGVHHLICQLESDPKFKVYRDGKVPADANRI